MKISELINEATLREYTIIGDKINDDFQLLAPIGEATTGDISWIRSGSKHIEELLSTCAASCIICSDATYQSVLKTGKEFSFVITESPEFIFHDILKYLKNEQDSDQTSTGTIHPTAIISKNCKLGNNVTIGAYCIVDSAVIGDNTVLGNNVRIFSNVTIGKNCLIREFCSIGGQGFGFIKTPENTYEHMPHIGKVIIEDDVQIFPFSNVDRATLSVTKIGKGARIDHYCHIGHNCSVGENTIIAAQVVTCGGVKIGQGCFIGVNTIIREKLAIGDFVTTGLCSVVTKSIPDHETWVGNPAQRFLKVRS